MIAIRGSRVAIELRNREARLAIFGNHHVGVRAAKPVGTDPHYDRQVPLWQGDGAVHDFKLKIVKRDVRIRHGEVQIRRQFTVLQRQQDLG
jgi:hypothetical protein